MSLYTDNAALAQARAARNANRVARYAPNTPTANRVGGKYVPKEPKNVIKGEVVKHDSHVKGKGDVANRPKPAPKKAPSGVVKAGERAAGGASKAWRVGRAIRVVGGPVGLAALGAEEVARYGVNKQKEKNAKGYHLTGTPNESGYGGMARPQYVKGAPPGAQEAAQRRTTTLDERRAERLKYGMHKGKYLGPDVFKGDMRMLKQWRSSGSPDSKKFAEDYKKVTGQKAETGWHGRYGVGQGADDKSRKTRPRGPSGPAYRGQWKAGSIKK